MERLSGSGGYIIIVSPDGPPVEQETTQCVHCDRHWVVEPGSGRLRGFCMRCGGPHCGGPKCWECRPFMAAIDAAFERTRRAESMGLVRG